MMPQIMPRQLAPYFGDQSPLVSRWWIWFCAIFAAGTILRFWDLDAAPIWMDEAVTLGFARLDLWTLMTKQVDNHPSLTWVVQHIWHNINPDPAWARAPAALFGSLSIAGIMLAVRDMVSARAGLFAGLFLAVSTGHIYYSQDARMYPFLVLGLILAAWGGLGQAKPQSYSPTFYAALYVLGGTIAIYSHVLGLIGMALIGFASLAAGLSVHNPRSFAVAWFLRNLVLLVLVLPWLIAIPSAMGSFPGLEGDNSLFDIQWFYRNVNGFAGLGSVALPFEALYFGLAGSAIALAWWQKRADIAYLLFGLIVVFPLIVLALHLRQPLLSNKVLLPGAIALAIGAAYALDKVRSNTAALAGAALIGLAGLASSANHLMHPIKSEDYRGAFAFADARDFSDAPALTCVHFHAAAAWENRRNGEILYYRRGEVLDYQGPEYWQAAEASMSVLRAADAFEIDALLGGGWLIEGGLESALANHDKVIFVRPSCPAGREDEIIRQLEALGFTSDGDTLIRGRAPDTPILEQPLTRVSLFQREPN